MAYPTSDTALRTDVIAAIVSAGTMAGSRVEDSRSSPYQPEETFPRVNVHTPDVSLDLGIATPAYERRTASLVIVGTIQTTLDADDTSASVATALASALDTFETQLTFALYTYVVENGVDSVRIRSVTKGRNTEAQTVLGQVGIVAELQYERPIAWPAPTNALETLGLELDLAVPAGGPEGRAEASRVIDLTEV